MTTPKYLLIGEFLQFGGIAAAIVGLILSLHHWPAAVSLVGGAAAFFIGKKLRTF
jgi:hypothetical protein